ncbi:MAG: hypothetical protein JSW45_10915 [Thiotrichales bacterium]|nr:MAG: hypothetical protein JSW45_10915 [Thiotrichales bacterium]
MFVPEKIKISNPRTELTDDQIRQMAMIAVNYFPDEQFLEAVVRHHAGQADTIRLAMEQDRIVGFSIASKYRLMTPFYPRPVNVLYQRMLYLKPGFLYRGIGLLLLSLTLKDLFGWLWPFKRFAAFCRTQNPVVARLMDMYSVSYPHYDQPVPEDVREFAEGLLPLVGAESLDQKFRLAGTLDAFSGMDYTEIWNRYLRRRNNQYEKLMLSSAFEQKDGRVINSGAFVLMIAYAKPLNFVRYLLRV